jgi:hypothetical protein
MIAAFASASVLKNASPVNEFSGSWSRNFLQLLKIRSTNATEQPFTNHLFFIVFI